MLYFLAIVIEDETAGRITRVKEEFRDRFGSGKALRSPPHITLIPPVELNENELADLKKEITSCVQELSSFQITLTGFKAFPPKVIYIGVENSTQLEAAYRKARDIYEKSLGEWKWDRPFRPHITVAFRDLAKENFKAAFREFRDREFSATVMGSAFTLLRNSPDGWRTESVFPFQGN